MSDAMTLDKRCGKVGALSCGRYIQPVRLAGSYRCWFVNKYCWLVCVREKYCSGWKFTIVYDRFPPAEYRYLVLESTHSCAASSNQICPPSFYLCMYGFEWYLAHPFARMGWGGSLLQFCVDMFVILRGGDTWQEAAGSVGEMMWQSLCSMYYRSSVKW